MNDDWTLKVADQDKASTFSSGAPQTVSDTIAYIQQTLLITLEDICASLLKDIPLKVFVLLPLVSPILALSLFYPF